MPTSYGESPPPRPTLSGYSNSGNSRRSWADPRWADAMIVHGNSSWPVHRVVICTISPYFEKALGGAYKVSQLHDGIRISEQQYLCIS